MNWGLNSKNAKIYLNIFMNISELESSLYILSSNQTTLSNYIFWYVSILTLNTYNTGHLFPVMCQHCHKICPGILGSVDWDDRHDQRAHRWAPQGWRWRLGCRSGSRLRAVAVMHDQGGAALALTKILGKQGHSENPNSFSINLLAAPQLPYCPKFNQDRPRAISGW